MEKEIKILYVHHGWGIGGAPLSLLLLMNNLKNKYSRKVIFLHNDKKVINLFTNNDIQTRICNKFNKYFFHHEKGKITFVNFYKLLNIIFDWLMTAFYYAPHILREETPDIVHLNSDVLSSWAFAAKRLNLKVVCHNRDPLANGLIGFRRFILRRILNYSVSRFISISNDNAKRLGLGSKTSVIYNAVDFEKFNLELSEKYDSLNKKKILFVGGLHKAKGFSILVDAIKYLNGNIQILLCGYYPNQSAALQSFSKMHKKLKTAKKYENVYILGVVTDIQNIMAAVNLILFPATLPHFARPVIEAGAMGKPVIASCLPGMDEIVLHNETGLLVEPNNPEALAKAINELICDEERQKLMGKNAYNRARELFDAEKNTRKVEEIYESLLPS